MLRMAIGDVRAGVACGLMAVCVALSGRAAPSSPSKILALDVPSAAMGKNVPTTERSLAFPHLVGKEFQGMEGVHTALFTPFRADGSLNEEMIDREIDYGYPSSCELPDGSVLTVYYHPRTVGEKPCLMATKWKPEGTR